MAPRASYGASVPEAAGGGLVSAVDAGSPAERAGVQPGDHVVAVDGEALRDILDWRWRSDGDRIEVAVRHGATTRCEALTRTPGTSWGLHFAELVFDGVRTCRNRCAFCFMTQLPRGLRRALYLRDDDFRLSFLQGNFVTLTNLSDADVDRIAEQHLSPLYVSLHAVDPDVRRELVCAREDRALERFDELLDAGIDVHVQVVLVPGVNDGAVLTETLTWLAEREGVLSVGIVPLGFTSHQERFAASFVGQAARAVVEQVAPWQVAFRERDGVTWVYLADEFYLSAGIEVPLAAEYDDFPQYENGIGIVRTFLDEIAERRAELDAAIAALAPGSRVALVTGTRAAPVLERALGSASCVELLPVANAFFGGNVSVAGLLTGRDLLAAMGQSPADVFLVPDIVVNADGLLLDDVPAAGLGIRSGREVRLVSCDAGGLVSALVALAEDKN